MQCREFSEISEAYLSDQLLVETNLQVFRHLETCQKCRYEFAAKRQLREQMKNAGRNSAAFEIDPMFASRLTATLRAAAREERTSWRAMFRLRFLVPAMATLLFTVALGWMFLAPSGGPDSVSMFPESLSKGLAELSLIAAGNHKDCAVEKLEQWESMSNSDYAEKAAFTDKVVRPLKLGFSEKVEMLHVHDCIYEGKSFLHVVLRKEGHVMSVFVDKTDAIPASDTLAAQIVTEREKGLQIARFTRNNRVIFVISDLSETENLSAARTLSDALKSQNSI